MREKHTSDTVKIGDSHGIETAAFCYGTETAAYSVSRHQRISENTSCEAPKGNERDEGGSHGYGL
jgi:hypothetical protein